MNRQAIDQFFTRLAALDPAPKGELNYLNPYTLLVAVVLSAQATDSGVNKATLGLFPLADTPAKMLALGEDRLKDHIKTIGLFNSKAKNVIALSRLLLDRHGGAVPADRCFWTTRDRGGYPHLPGRQPHRHGAGQDARLGRTRIGTARAGALEAACPSLADPARALYLQSPQTRL